MDGVRIALDIELNDNEDRKRVVIHIYHREKDETRSLVFTYQEFFKKMFGRRYWFNDEKFIVDMIRSSNRNDGSDNWFA